MWQRRTDESRLLHLLHFVAIRGVMCSELVVVGASDTKGATDAARTEQVDVAVLDLAIEDGSTFPVAAILHERGIPFIFMTGLNISKAREKFGGTRVLEKPFGAQALEDALRSLQTPQAPKG